MSTSAKIVQIRKKIASKRKKLEANQTQLNAVKKEVEELEEELIQLQLQQLNTVLAAKGITTDEVCEAIAAGIFDKSESDKNRATYSTNSAEPVKEVKADEVSGS